MNSIEKMKIRFEIYAENIPKKIAKNTYFVVFQDSQLDLLTLVLDFFWCRVILLLTFLGTTTKTKHQMKC